MTIKVQGIAKNQKQNMSHLTIKQQLPLTITIAILK